MGCSLSVDGGPGMYGDAFNDMEGRPTPVSTGVYGLTTKVSLFSWDGSSRPDGLFPNTTGRSNRWLDSFSKLMGRAGSGLLSRSRLNPNPFDIDYGPGEG